MPDALTNRYGYEVTAMSESNYETIFALHQEKWHGFDIYYGEDRKGTCLNYYCRVKCERDHAFDLEGSVDVVTLPSSQPGMLQRIPQLTLARARAIIDLRSFGWGQTIKCSLDVPRTSDNPDISNDELRPRLLGIFYTLWRTLPRSYDTAQGRVDIDGLCMELEISENQYLSTTDYLLRKGWLERFLERLDNHSQVFITEHGIDEHEEQRSLGQVADPPSERPDFSFITDSDLRSIIQRDYEEIDKCLGVAACKAATVMCGSVMEALLLDRLLGDEAKARKCAEALRSKIGKVNKDLRRWNLNQMIEVAVGLGIVPDLSARMADALREYRNLIHPAVEIRKQMPPGREEGSLARSALDLIIKNLGQSP